MEPSDAERMKMALKNLIERLDAGGYRDYTDDCLMCGERNGPCESTCPTEVARAVLLASTKKQEK